MTRPRKIFLGFGVTLFAAIVLVFVHTCIFVPLKFRYLVRQVESARTAEEERRAFQLAADWGRVWEVDRLSPKDMAADGRRITGDWLLRLEWLESSPFGGGAYVAYRAVIDTNNLRVLARSYWDMTVPPNQAAPVNAPVAPSFHTEHCWRRVTEQRRSLRRSRSL